MYEEKKTVAFIKLKIATFCLNLEKWDFDVRRYGEGEGLSYFMVWKRKVFENGIQESDDSRWNVESLHKNVLKLLHQRQPITSLS